MPIIADAPVPVKAAAQVSRIRNIRNDETLAGPWRRFGCFGMGGREQKNRPCATSRIATQQANEIGWLSGVIQEVA